jgi:mono/diheme cytochrome c family protein
MKTIAMTSAVIMLALTPFGANAADIKHGQRLAKQWCTGCHLTGADQSSGGDAAPPFSLIAESAADRNDDLRAWLADPHPPMPNFNLTRWEIDDLLAYIESLNTK